MDDEVEDDACIEEEAIRGREAAAAALRGGMRSLAVTIAMLVRLLEGAKGEKKRRGLTGVEQRRETSIDFFCSEKE